jgi:hypothetical protein
MLERGLRGAESSVPAKNIIGSETGTYGSLLRLADQQVNLFGHDHIAERAHSETASEALKCRFNGTHLGTTERWTAMIAAEGNEVALAGFVEAPQSPGHGIL